MEDLLIMFLILVLLGGFLLTIKILLLQKEIRRLERAIKWGNQRQNKIIYKS